VPAERRGFPGRTSAPSVSQPAPARGTGDTIDPGAIIDWCSGRLRAGARALGTHAAWPFARGARIGTRVGGGVVRRPVRLSASDLARGDERAAEGWYQRSGRSRPSQAIARTDATSDTAPEAE